MAHPLTLLHLHLTGHLHSPPLTLRHTLDRHTPRVRPHTPQGAQQVSPPPTTTPPPGQVPLTDRRHLHLRMDPLHLTLTALRLRTDPHLLPTALRRLPMDLHLPPTAPPLPPTDHLDNTLRHRKIPTTQLGTVGQLTTPNIKFK